MGGEHPSLTGDAGPPLEAWEYVRWRRNGHVALRRSAKEHVVIEDGIPSVDMLWRSRAATTIREITGSRSACGRVPWAICSPWPSHMSAR
jgi:hypothetical protein